MIFLKYLATSFTLVCFTCTKHVMRELNAAVWHAFTKIQVFEVGRVKSFVMFHFTCKYESL